MADLLEIGASGLLSAQTGIATTGHNITNANVEGYTRQETLYGAQIPQRSDGGFVGSGVVTKEIRRVSDQFLTNQLRADIQQFEQFDTYVSFVSQLEALLANEQAGLASGMQSFFASLQAAGEDPASITARQQILGEASNLANRFNTLYSKIESQSSSINQQVSLMVNQINSISENIAKLNQKIGLAQGVTAGASPNDLLDQRDILLNDLSKLVSVKTTVQDGNQINVFIGKGQSLVLGATSTKLNAFNSPTRPGEIDIGVGNTVINEGLEGGSLGALLMVRGEVMTPALNQLGQLAIGLADQMNKQQALGIDLFDRLGLDLFADINAFETRVNRALPSASNNPDSTGQLSVSIDDVSLLTTDDYVLTFTGPTALDFTLTRGSGGEVLAAGQFQGNLPSSFLTRDGFSITLEAGAFFPGDSVVIQPTRSGARDFSVQLERPEGLALAQPVRTSTAVHNTGTGSISAGSMLATRSTNGQDFLADFQTAGELSPPLIVRFLTDTRYMILDNSDPNAPVPFSPPIINAEFIPGAENQLFPSDPSDPNFRGYMVSINGAPRAGDQFNIDFNEAGVGDNRNALAMIGLQGEAIMNRGVDSFTTLYGGMVQTIASKVGQARTDRDAAESLKLQTQNARDGVSAVNLDEEAARLIQLEQAYNASSQVIQVARDLFNTLLQAVS